MTVIFLSAIFILLNAIFMLLVREIPMAIIFYVLSMITWFGGVIVMVLK